MKNGAFDFSHAAEAAGGGSLGIHDPFARLVGESVALRRAVATARRLAQVDAPILLQGETGVGKEVFARAIHDGGPNAQGPFVVLNCGGLPRDILASELFGYVDGAFTGARRGGVVGKIEAANEGTLFLDEIGEMPLDVQPYFLRVLEGGEVHPLGSVRPRKVRFRLLTASNRELRDEVAAGRFRSDLFYRVSVTSLRLPALRERLEDVPALVEHFCREATRRHGLDERRFAADVVALFGAQAWPGNLRELRNVVESMVFLSDGDEIDRRVLPPDFGAAAPVVPVVESAVPPDASLERVERDAIGSAIRAHRGNLTQVARDLRISKSTLYFKMRKYALESIVSQVRFARGVGGERRADAGVVQTRC